DFNPTQAAVILISVWLCIGGSMLRYYYRHEIPGALKLLIKIGAVLIILNLARELWLENLHSQHFQFLYPLVDALVSASVLTSFELRTRGEIVGSSAFGLALMELAGCSGRSVFFGGCVVLYVALGAALLCFNARRQSVDLSRADKALASAITGGAHLPAIF